MQIAAIILRESHDSMKCRQTVVCSRAPNIATIAPCIHYIRIWRFSHKISLLITRSETQKDRKDCLYLDASTAIIRSRLFNTEITRNFCRNRKSSKCIPPTRKQHPKIVSECNLIFRTETETSVIRSSSRTKAC